MYVYIKFTELLARIAVVKSTILVLCMDAFMIRTLKNDLYSRDVLVNFSGNGVRDSQKLRLVRILRSTVMVRVGGGWEPLEEFLHDPYLLRLAWQNSLCLIPHFLVEISRGHDGTSLQVF